MKNGEDLCNIFDIGNDYVGLGDLIPVMIGDKENYLKPDGTFLFKKWYESIGPFSEGFAWVEVECGRYNYIDMNGNLLLDKNYYECYNFINGFGCIEEPQDDMSYYRPIRRDGTFLTNDRFTWTGSFSDGLMPVESVDGTYNFLKEDGTYLLSEWMDNYSHGFRNGCAVINKGNHKKRVIKRDGTDLIDMDFAFCDDFDDGDIATVCIFDKPTRRYLYNLLRNDGTFVFRTFTPHELLSFSDGFAAIKLNDGWNYINEQGDILSKERYDECNKFHDGYAVVKSKEGEYYSLLKKDGTRINNFWYDTIDMLYYREDFIAYVRRDGKWNILKEDGTVIPELWSYRHPPILHGNVVAKCCNLSPYTWLLYNIDGTQISEQQFDGYGGTNKLYLVLYANAEKYFVDKNGKIIQDTRGDKY